MTQYSKQYQGCGLSSACIKSFALEAAQQFAQFDSNLAGFEIPARLSSYESSMDATTRKLNRLYEAIYHGASIAANTATISSSQQVLLSEYERLVKAWS